MSHPIFRAFPDADVETLEALHRVAPGHPFASPAYAESRAETGEAATVLALVRDGEIEAGCLCFIGGKGGGRSAEIPSAPHVEPDGPFWDGVTRYCRSRGARLLAIRTFGSPPLDIPRLRGETNRWGRWEYVLDLRRDDLLGGLSSNHRRSIKRALKAGIDVERTTDLSALRDHVALQQSSMARRAGRGEQVPVVTVSPVHEAMLRRGAAEIFQARSQDTVLSSLLVVRDHRSAYYYSAGTNEAGMRIGASPFLIEAVAAALRDEGFETLNLGGVRPENDGLRRFKAGFGGHPVRLEAVDVVLGSRVLRKLRSAARLARVGPKAVLGALVRVERFAVYSAEPGQIASSVVDEPGWSMRPLSDSDLRGLRGTSFDEQARRFERTGYNRAHGLFFKGELVHVAWLLDCQVDRRRAIRHLSLRPGEMEITHCFTSYERRGGGAYRRAIMRLCVEASRMDCKRLFMITSFENRASQRGIEKAGLTRCGSIVRREILQLPLRIAWTSRRFRS